MMAPERIENAKQVSMVSYLAALAIEPIKTVGHQLVYISPFKEEQTPSFFVNQERNVFKDFTTDEKGGDVITLVRRLQKCSFVQAVELLEVFNGNGNSFSFSGPKTHSFDSSKFNVQKIKNLENKALVGYLEDQRGIPFSIASCYVKECYFTLNGKKQFAVCFENDLHGWELRNKYVKLSTTPKAISTLKGESSQSVMVFEGFVNFLSYVVMEGKPTYDVVVLNSVTANLTTALPQLKLYRTVYGYLDNDSAGNVGTQTLQNSGISLIDCRPIYGSFKDLNDALQTPKLTN